MSQHYPGILEGKIRLGHYPMEKLKRVDRPTTLISGEIPRFDERQTAFNRAHRGELGPIGEGGLPRERELISRAIIGTFASFPPVDAAAAPEKAALPVDPAVMSRHIKSLGYFLRADMMGICELPQYAVYSYNNEGNPVECRHKYAVCVVIDQGYRTFEASRGDDWISVSQSFRGYSASAFIAYQIAGYIRSLGYPARVHHAMNYQVIVPPLLVLAGIGEMGRAGIVLNPFLGMRLKAAIVTTDLPLQPDKPVDFGLRDFCDKCQKCALECPPHAISDGPRVTHNGYETWKFDAERCAKYRLGNANGAMCGRCIKVCPWNKPEGLLHDSVCWMVKNTPFLNSLIISMDDLLGYGKQHKELQWWFDPA